jgi:hypothetical protein
VVLADTNCAQLRFQNQNLSSLLRDRVSGTEVIIRKTPERTARVASSGLSYFVLASGSRSFKPAFQIGGQLVTLRVIVPNGP